MTICRIIFILIDPSACSAKFVSFCCEFSGLFLHSLCVCLQVSLHREFIFRNSKRHYNGVPVVASNMDTVGTFEAALELGRVSFTMGHNF